MILILTRFSTYTKMDNGMITLHNNDDMRQPRKVVVKLKVKKPWELSTGHREDRGNTTMDNRPKRQRTRKDIERSWQREND